MANDARTGTESGTMMRRKTAKWEAPSVTAESIRSRGISLTKPNTR